MARTDEAAIFFHAVYSAVQEIPHGKVTSYAHIAMLVGTRKTLYQPVSSSTPSAHCDNLVANRFLGQHNDPDKWASA